jgi:uncharacterized protein (UPF0210 family)
MIPIVEKLKVLRLRAELAIATEPLPSKESPVVCIIEALHDSITPGFSNRDEDHLDSHRQAKPEHDTQGTRITIASPETERVVDLKEVRKAHCLPTTDQSQSHRLVVFSSLGIDKDSMAVEIHDMERKEAAIVLDIPGTQEICLMDVIDTQRLPEIRVFHPFGGIRSFF